MNTDHPHLRPFDGSREPDHLGRAVLDGLSRPAYQKLSWGLGRTLLLGLGSFGVLPILVWTKRFRQYITLEQQQLWHLAEWMRLNTSHPQTVALKDDAEAMRPHADLRLLVFLSVGLMAILFFTQLEGADRRHWFDSLLNCTYLYPFHRLHAVTYYFRRLDSSLTFRLFNTWTLALCTAYACHWLQVRQHAIALRKFVARFNTIAAGEGLPPVRAKMPGYGLRPLWLAAAVVMALGGVLWGVPMMLAGAAHRRMVRTVSTANRAAIAGHFRTMLQSRRPHETMPMPVYLRPACPNDKCRAPVATSAAFCPRCGTRLSPMNRA